MGTTGKIDIYYQWLASPDGKATLATTTDPSKDVVTLTWDSDTGLAPRRVGAIRGDGQHSKRGHRIAGNGVDLRRLQDRRHAVYSEALRSIPEHHRISRDTADAQSHSPSRSCRGRQPILRGFGRLRSRGGADEAYREHELQRRRTSAAAASQAAWRRCGGRGWNVKPVDDSRGFATISVSARPGPTEIPAVVRTAQGRALQAVSSLPSLPSAPRIRSRRFSRCHSPRRRSQCQHCWHPTSRRKLSKSPRC